MKSKVKERNRNQWRGFGTDLIKHAYTGWSKRPIGTAATADRM